MKKNFCFLGLISLFLIGGLTSCSDDDKTPDDDAITQESGKYLIAASSAEAVYLLTADRLDEGSLTIVNSGIEAESATAWIFHSRKYAYRLVYNQGNAGTGSSYILDENGALKERSIKFEITNRFTTYGACGQHVITAASGATAFFDAADAEKKYPKYGVTFTFLNVEEQTLDTRTVITENLVDGNGEYFTVSGLVESGGKIYTALCPQGYSPYGVQQGHPDIDAALVLKPDLVSTTGAITTSLHPNKCWIGIYNNVSFENPKIISDERLSYASSRFRSQFYETIAANSEGDIYVFSAANAAANEGVFASDRPSGALRIKAGAEAFDKDYFFDVEAASGGCHLFKVWFITGNYFLLQMYAEPGVTTSITADTRRLAIIDAVAKSFKWVDGGMPERSIISSFGSFPYFEDGKAYMPIVTTDGLQPAVYVVDPATATAVKGVSVTSASISAIGKLEY
ncbi:MAG: DUF4374 domain-containing protein [Tannerella sp.]|jgi:hypothetical protein|nr:DUF4374 domain-containing protein [Tannerella sp.]